jgi:acyl-[acyl-carrier-protein] desaturase
MRHHLAYREFIKKILEVDASEVLTVFADMMKRKIAMPAKLLRQSGQAVGESFQAFADAAQRLGVYTADDYVQILKTLLAHWNIEGLRGLNESAEKSRDYLMALPARLERLSERMKVPTQSVRFKWVDAL